jgi:hypothetical protein
VVQINPAPRPRLPALLIGHECPIRTLDAPRRSGRRAAPRQPIPISGPSPDERTASTRLPVSARANAGATSGPRHIAVPIARLCRSCMAYTPHALGLGCPARQRYSFSVETGRSAQMKSDARSRQNSGSPSCAIRSVGSNKALRRSVTSHDDYGVPARSSLGGAASTEAVSTSLLVPLTPASHWPAHWRGGQRPLPRWTLRRRPRIAPTVHVAPQGTHSGTVLPTSRTTPPASRPS